VSRANPKSIEVRSKKPRGPVPGAKRPTSPAQRAHARVAAWKHGLRAETVSFMEAETTKLSKMHSDAPFIAESYRQAIMEGKPRETEALSVVAMAQNEVTRRKMVEAVEEKGVLVEDDLVNSEGKKIGIKYKANPVLEHLAEMNRTLGHNVTDLQLSKKSRGEGARDDALRKLAERSELLRSGDKSLPPPMAFDTTARRVK
jgi:hypothetical protein